MAARSIIAITHAQSGKCCPCFLNNGRISLINYLGIVNANVSDTVIEVVTDGENTVMHKDLKCFGCHIGRCKLGCRFSLPIGMNAAKTSLGILGNIKGVCLSLFDSIKFVLQPLIRVFGEGLTSARCYGVTADNQLLGANNDWNVLEDMAECGTSAPYNRQAFGRAVTFGQKLRTVSLNFGHFCIKMCNQSINTTAFFNTEYSHIRTAPLSEMKKAN